VYSSPDYDVVTVAVQVSQPIVLASLLFCLPAYQGSVVADVSDDGDQRRE
jgi:hypothetical protein